MSSTMAIVTITKMRNLCQIGTRASHQHVREYLADLQDELK